MTALLRRLKEVADAHESARIFVGLLAEATRRFGALLAELDAEIEQQRAYLERRHMPVEVDSALAALEKRRNNLVKSLETLRNAAPLAEENLRVSTEQLNEIGAFNLRAPRAREEAS